MTSKLQEIVAAQILPRVQTPAQYVGGELNSVVKPTREVRGRVCLATPDAYTIGMSNHGLQVLYDLMNRGTDWACERAFAPWPDMEALLREHDVPLYSLESFTPLAEFDVVGFTLQYDLGYSNVLTILDLGRIPLRSEDRTLADPLVIAGGPCAENPEPMADFFDAFVIGDGEESLPAVCEAWLELRASSPDRPTALRELASRFPYLYVPSCYRLEEADGRWIPWSTAEAVSDMIHPAVISSLEESPLPLAPIVPLIRAVQDRVAVEIMRGCPWRCRFCQSTTIKRPLRYRQVETIVEAALAAYHNTGIDEIALLSLSSSDYPKFEELIRRVRDELAPLDVSISVPSLRVNKQWRTLSELLTTERHSSLTLAPEVALDDMRKQIGKPIRNDDLLEGCRTAFHRGFHRVKLYFLCGLPGEREADLNGMIDLAEEIARLGKSIRGRSVKVVVNVSNFVPKPQTPYQWAGMQTRAYFRWAREQLYHRRRLKAVDVKCHDVEASLLEGVMSRGDRRVGRAIEAAWRKGARFDSWNDYLQPELWWDTLAEQDIDLQHLLHEGVEVESPLPWDRVAIRQGRPYLERERDRSRDQLALMQQGVS